MLAVFAPPLVVQLEEPIVTTSIGIISIIGPGVEVALILSQADPCVRESKRCGHKRESAPWWDTTFAVLELPEKKVY